MWPWLRTFSKVIFHKEDIWSETSPDGTTHMQQCPCYEK